MKISNNRFEESDIKTRKRHEVMLTTDSPDSVSGEIELSASDVIHTSPSEKALANKAQKQGKEAEGQNVPIVPVEGDKEPVQDEATENTVTEEQVQMTTEDTVEEQTENVVGNVENEEEATVAISEEVTEGVEESVEQPIEAAKEEVSALPKKKRFRLSLTERKALSGWLFVLPFVIGIIFIYAPIVFDSLQISLSDYTLVPGRMDLEWNNFANYKYLFAKDGDPYFSITIVDGIKDLLLQIPAIVIFSLFMAIILNQKMTGRAVFRAIFFLPVILSTGIIDAIDTKSAFMQSVSNSQGGVDDNTGEEAGGIMSAMDLETMLSGIKIGTELVTYVVDLVNNIFDIVSRSGVQMLIFLSGLQSISPAIYESCEVEGASAWETFWKITLPMISPMILVNAIYTVIDAFTAADNRVMVYIEKIYSQSKFAISSAMSWVYVGVVLLFIVLVALIMKTVVFYQRRD